MMGMGGPPQPLSKRVFNKYDTDKSGSITTKEFKDLAYEMGYFLSPSELDLATSQLDKDGSGSISYEEFRQWWASDNRFAKLQSHDSEQDALYQHLAAFRQADKDHSGSLSRQEFGPVYEKLKAANATRKPLDACFNDLDTDRSGHVSFNEYTNWLVRETGERP
eukprot:TRINITY_DN464_c0_g1_i1.p1 TRINITY_DN464_c0_g1~~TRINITY_DN464_c0_g1_i1.p1  ORF type:complete len:164 (-),score=38.35 TRINITY_DN464_c0_g1_i1:38-529(-)